MGIDMPTLNGPVERLPSPAASHGARVEIVPHLDLPGFVVTFARNEEIFGAEEPAEMVYKVVSGAVRTTRILGDGRRQVGGFFLRGDTFGLQRGAVHRFTADAVTRSEVAMVRRSAVEAAALRDGATARQLWLLTARELERVEDHMVLLGRKTALERVAAFLLRLSAPRHATGAIVDLVMSRMDIADYLGLTIETVSRTLTQLEHEHAIARPNTRQIVLRNPAALAALSV
jgi:CRP/FNR family nitrogen fixation transcriptional regulator